METKVNRTLVHTATTGGEAFVKELYYKVFDKKRPELIRIYNDNSVVMWNGNSLKGTAVIGDFFSKLPSSEHILQSIDVQHIPGTVEGVKALNLLVVVSGKVRYEGEVEKSFSQTFILTQESGGKFYVSSDCFRFIH